jgi:amino acid transporter
MILVLFTYGGWNEMAYVAAEVDQPNRNIARALLLGTAAVVVLYLLINAVFLYALGYAGLAVSGAVAVDTVATVLPESAVRIIGIIICISALGAVNGLIFTGARISYAMGTGHRVFKALGRWNPRFGTPVAALVLQGWISLIIILLAGSFIDTILYSAPVVWIFFLATGVALFRLRRKDAGQPRPFKLTGYPFTPLLFCAASAFMAYSSISYALSARPAGMAVLAGMLLCGLACYVLSRSKKGGSAYL